MERDDYLASEFEQHRDHLRAVAGRLTVAVTDFGA